MGKKLDVLGKKFGKLTVIKESHRDKKGVIYYFCICDCGGTKITTAGRLVRGVGTHCGCERRIKSPDLVGRRFGRLTVLENVGKGKYGEIKYKCLCDCSNICIINSTDLLREDGKGSRSCGCLHKEKASKRLRKDYTGYKIGRLTYIECVSYDEKDHSYNWRGLCECGSTVITSTKVISKIKSCGCLLADVLNERNKSMALPYGESAFNATYRHYKSNAKKRNLSFALTKEEFKELTQQNCYYCGDPPSNKYLGKRLTVNGIYTYNGLDRVDSSKGYKIGNVVACCKICNRAKRALPIEVFVYWICRMSKHKDKLIKKLFDDKIIEGEHTTELILKIES